LDRVPGSESGGLRDRDAVLGRLERLLDEARAAAATEAALVRAGPLGDAR
jgi:hypothetical protein